MRWECWMGDVHAAEGWAERSNCSMGRRGGEAMKWNDRLFAWYSGCQSEAAVQLKGWHERQSSNSLQIHWHGRFDM